MTAPINVVTEAFRRMDAAFDQANSDQDAAYRSVTAAQEQLRIHWSGEASKVYHDAMNEWMEGFVKVNKALKQLNEGMVSYSNTTDTTEDDSIVDANFVREASWT